MAWMGERPGDLGEGHTTSWGFMPTYVSHLQSRLVYGIILPGAVLRRWIWDEGGHEVVRKSYGWLNLIEEA